MRYGYGSSFSEQAAYSLHGRLFCLSGCDRHPDVTRAIARQLARERAQAPRLTIIDAHERAELERLLGEHEPGPDAILARFEATGDEDQAAAAERGRVLELIRWIVGAVLSAGLGVVLGILVVVTFALIMGLLAPGG